MHDTVPAFVTDCKRKGHAWYVDMDEQRDFLTVRCFDLMASSLPMSVQQYAKHIPASLEYACIHWSDHLVDCPYSEHAVRRVRTSLENHVTFWVTALSVLERMDVAGPTLESVSSWVPLSVFLVAEFSPKSQSFIFSKPQDADLAALLIESRTGVDATLSVQALYL